MGGELVLDKDGAACKACKAYKATHASYVVVADANGIVVYSGVEAEQDIDSAIQKALSAMQHSM